MLSFCNFRDRPSSNSPVKQSFALDTWHLIGALCTPPLPDDRVRLIKPRSAMQKKKKTPGVREGSVGRARVFCNFLRDEIDNAKCRVEELISGDRGRDGQRRRGAPTSCDVTGALRSRASPPPTLTHTRTRTHALTKWLLRHRPESVETRLMRRSYARCAGGRGPKGGAYDGGKRRTICEFCLL